MTTTDRDTMQPTRPLDAAQRFFWDNAGWAYKPGAESREQGRTDGALRLAAAEALYLQAHRVAEVDCLWADEEVDQGDRGNAEGPFESCCLRVDGRIVASLGAVDQPDAAYRRVVRAELALEASEELVRAIAQHA